MSDASSVPVLYDLVFRKGARSPYFSPHTCKARLALAHKQVDFKTVEVTYHDVRASLAQKLGVKKATVPILQLPSGELIMDSLTIAEYLEKTYPDRPSLFFPGATNPVDPQSAQAKMARAFLTMFGAGMSDSDSLWSPMWELACPKLADRQDPAGGPDSVQAYFKSDGKQGVPGEFDRIAALDQVALVKHARASLMPIEATLRGSPFLAGDDASFVDFILYGRYMMLACADQKVADEVWQHWPRVGDWMARLEARYADSSEWRDALARLREGSQ